MPGIAEHAVPGINVCAESDDVDISDVDIVVRRVGVPYEDIHSNEMRAMTSYPR